MIRFDADCPHATATSAPLQVSIEDWDLLFRAVLARLTLAVNRSPDHDLQDRVADCAQALEQLRLSMVDDFARRARDAG